MSQLITHVRLVASTGVRSTGAQHACHQSIWPKHPKQATNGDGLPNDLPLYVDLVTSCSSCDLAPQTEAWKLCFGTAHSDGASVT
eukprot:3725740-Amphidinium_carterae.1